MGRERPPFEPGNAVALKHGADSERAIAERAELVHTELLDVAPYLDEPKFIPAVRRYLAAAAREALLDEYVQRLSAEKGVGAVASRLWEQVTAATRLAAKLGDDLGLSPIGHARIRALALGADRSEATLAELSAEGRQALAARSVDGDADVEDGA